MAPLEHTSFLLGTDRIGRDTLSRLVYGARTSVLVILGVVCISATIGTMLGLAAGYCGGWVDRIIVGPTAEIDNLPAWARIMVSISIGLPIVLVAAVILFPATIELVLVISVLGIPRVSLAVRNTILGIRIWKPLTTAEIDASFPPASLKPRVLTSIIITLLIVGSLQTKQISLIGAFFSFLGLEPLPVSSSWGAMVSAGRDNLIRLWWLSLLPLAAIAVTSAAFYFFGRWVEDTLEPRLQRRPRGSRI
ncbi:ABC transporter permease [Achromobacter marplatensis]|uniref:ABC transporter permease n=1 Tax=Achromobacter marplatensis TaxID=470868 RepID=UPI003C70975B